MIESAMMERIMPVEERFAMTQTKTPGPSAPFHRNALPRRYRAWNYMSECGVDTQEN